jgi:transcriptional regulator with XRE-family HTH domain
MKEIHGLRLIKLGDFIKEVRQSKNYTQQVLSELADIDIRTLQRIEKGQLNLSLNIFIAIINALELDATYVIQKVTEG